MVEKHVAWDPTFSIYEASRDSCARADAAVVQGLPAPVDGGVLQGIARQSRLVLHRLDLARRKRTGSSSTGSGWTRCASSRNKGGLVTTGDDAGYIYSMYGFGISRELELQEEAGFHPLEVIEHATWNGARLLGMEDRHRQGPRRLHRRSAGRQRQPAREPEAAESRTAPT